MKSFASDHTQKQALIIGGTSGIGLAIACSLASDPKIRSVHIIGRHRPTEELSSLSLDQQQKITFIPHDLSVVDQIETINLSNYSSVFYTAGFGALSHFKDVPFAELDALFNVNTIAFIKITSKLYDRLARPRPFNLCVISSISGKIASPLFSVYGATKAALCSFCESVNAELAFQNTDNRITNICPGRIEGTKFHSANNNLDTNLAFAAEIIEKSRQNCELWIPNFEAVYGDVLNKYHNDPKSFALESYKYKKAKINE